MRFRFNPGALFTLLILLIFFGGVFTARQWQFQARLFPWTIGIPALLLCIAQLAMDLFRTTESDNSDDVSGLMDLPVDRSVPVSVVVHRAVNSFGWVIGFMLVIWLIGFIISVPLFVLLYLLIQAREKLWVSLVYTGAMLIFLLGVFHQVLHIPWPPGVFPGPQEMILVWIGG
ncbi:MAG: tripartite tricarboxylate transporter TctB family protein [Candidatus Binatia bacterium]